MQPISHRYYFGRLTDSRVALLVVLLFLPAGSVIAQWEAPVRFATTGDSVTTSYTNARCLVASGDIVHAVWSEKGGPLWHTAYARSTDRGESWEAPIMLTTPGNPIRGQSPSIAASGDDVHVVWVDLRSGIEIVYYRRSTDNGLTWSAETALTPPTAKCYAPAIVASGAHVSVAWSRSDLIGRCIYSRRSTDNGQSWEEQIPICESYFAEAPALACSGGIIHVAWYDSRYGPSDVFHRRSTDLGATWMEETRMSFGPMANTGMAIDASGSDVHLVWHKYEAGCWNIHYRYSENGGASWGGDYPITTTNPVSFFPTLHVSGKHVHVVWVDLRLGGDIYYTFSSDAGVNWETECRVTEDTTFSAYPFVCTTGDVVHLLWAEAYKSIGYRRNPTGNKVTSIIPNTVKPVDISLHGNSPNPFTSGSSIRYSIPAASSVRLTLHDLLGRRLTVISEGSRSAGTHVAHIDASGLPAGSYLCRLSCEGQQRTRLITVLR